MLLKQTNVANELERNGSDMERVYFTNGLFHDITRVHGGTCTCTYY